MPARMPCTTAESSVANDDRAADFGEPRQQLQLVPPVERREAHQAVDHRRTVGEEVVQRDDHDDQADENADRGPGNQRQDVADPGDAHPARFSQIVSFNGDPGLFVQRSSAHFVDLSQTSVA